MFVYHLSYSSLSSKGRGFFGVYKNLVKVTHIHRTSFMLNLGFRSRNFVLPREGFSPNSGFTKTLCTPENPLIEKESTRSTQ